MEDTILTSVVVLFGIVSSCQGQSSFPTKIATQPNTWGTSTADRAIDGNINTCSLSAISQEPRSGFGWWQVDLGDVFTVYSVTVTSGSSDGSTPEYARNFAISVGTTNSTTDIDYYIGLCYNFYNGSYLPAGIPTTFTCEPNPLNGRYVTIKRRGGDRPDALGLCEVSIQYNTVNILSTSSSTSTLSSSSTSRTATSPSSSKSITSSNLMPTSSSSSSSSKDSLGSNTQSFLSSTTQSSNASSLNDTSNPGSAMDQKTRTTIICVVVIIGGLLLLGGGAVLIYFLLRKSREGKLFKGGLKATKKPRKIEIVTSRRPSTGPNSPISSEHDVLTKSIQDTDLPAYVENKKSDLGSFKADFKKLPEDECREANVSRRSENKSKNRFANVLPYDHTMVQLEIEEYDDPDGDYINANFITGYKNKEKMYIATQGPRPNTLEDFWRMIWQQNVNLVVMITLLTEAGKKKCERYWPEKLGSSQTFHKITVTLTGEETYAHYAYREMIVHDQRKDDMPPRTVRQMHFLTWSDKTRPDHFLSLLSFRRKVRTFQEDTTGPVVIHCSAGIGRTGTYIALDYLLEQLKEEHECSVFGCVEELRYQRMGMVQTSEQYVFLHEALVDGIQAGDTGIPCSEFIRQFVDMAKPWPDGSLSTLEQQFVLLKKLKEFKTEKYSSGNERINISKNRDKDIVAYDDGRPHLESTYYNGTDYVNAVYADSYRMKDAFILTQWPLQETIVDFWRLLWDHRLKTIVLLNEYDPNDESCPMYWPDGESGSEAYGPFEVQTNGTTEISQTIFLREFTLTNTKEKRADSLAIRQYNLNAWPNGSSIPSTSGLLLELINVLMTNLNNEPLVIQCIDGAARSGLFAAAMYLVEMMKIEQVVDVFFACRFIAINRPQVVDSMMHYSFLHDFGCSCLMQYEEYENLKSTTSAVSPKPPRKPLNHDNGVYANAGDSKPATIRAPIKPKPIKLGEF